MQRCITCRSREQQKSAEPLLLQLTCNKLVVIQPSMSLLKFLGDRGPKGSVRWIFAAMQVLNWPPLGVPVILFKQLRSFANIHTFFLWEGCMVSSNSIHLSSCGRFAFCGLFSSPVSSEASCGPTVWRLGCALSDHERSAAGACDASPAQANQRRLLGISAMPPVILFLFRLAFSCELAIVSGCEIPLRCRPHKRREKQDQIMPT